MESRRGERFFLADWLDMIFLHFEVDGDALQRLVPVEIDRFEGRTWVSLVAFTMRGMRFARGGAATRWLTAPIATHRFLNIRTYVRHEGTAGIFFLREWLDNRLAVAIGPATFSLPYRLGTIRYDHSREEGGSARVEAGEGSLGWDLGPRGRERIAGPGTLESFLLERYVAFAAGGGCPRFFRVWHRPWRFGDVEIAWRGKSLLENTFPGLFADSALAGAHGSEGVRDVWMGRPHRVAGC